MDTEKYGMALILVIAFMLCRGGVAQSRCSSKVVGLSSCITYMTRNSSKPSSSCCKSLDSLIQSEPECLCPMLNNGAGFSLGIAINRTLALALPAACNMQTPPVSQCNKLASGSAGAPAPSALLGGAFPEPPESPATTTIPPVPSGSNTIPDTDENTSEGSTTALPIYLRFAVIFIAAWTTNTYQF